MARALHDLPGLVQALRAARAWSERPTRYLGYSKGRAWSSVDRALAEGLDYYEASLNPLGIPAWIARDPDRKFTVDEAVDQAMAVYEEAQEEMRKGESATPGLILGVIDLGPSED